MRKETRRLTLSSEFKSLTLDRSKSISFSTKRRQQTHAPFLAALYIRYVQRLAAYESVSRRSSTIFHSVETCAREISGARLNNRARRMHSIVAATCPNGYSIRIGFACFLSWETFSRSVPSENFARLCLSSRDDARGCRVQSFWGKLANSILTLRRWRVILYIYDVRCNTSSRLHVTFPCNWSRSCRKFDRARSEKHGISWNINIYRYIIEQNVKIYLFIRFVLLYDNKFSKTRYIIEAIKILYILISLKKKKNCKYHVYFVI